MYQEFVTLCPKGKFLGEVTLNLETQNRLVIFRTKLLHRDETYNSGTSCPDERLKGNL